MVAYTDSQLLPYQTGGDLRCDAASDSERGIKGMWQQFVERFEERLVPLINVGNRVTNPPVAVVERRVPIPGAEFDAGDELRIPFDTVVADSDGMVNFDESRYYVTPQRAGWYVAWATFRTLDYDVGNTQIGIIIDGGGAGNSANHQFQGSPIAEYQIYAAQQTSEKALDLSMSVARYWNPGETGFNSMEPFSLQKLGSASGQYGVEWAQLGVAWFGDVA